MSITSLAAPSAIASAAAAVSALTLCTTPSASGATVETTGIRPASIRSMTAAGLTVDHVADQPDVGGDAVDQHGAAGRGEQAGVLAGHPDGQRTVRVDQPDQLPADLADQHHPDDVHGVRRGDPEAALELARQAEPLQHGADLRPAAVHHDRPQPDGAQEHHVGGEGGLQRVVGHRVAAVLDHHDRPGEPAQPGQRAGQHLGPLPGAFQVGLPSRLDTVA